MSDPWGITGHTHGNREEHAMPLLEDFCSFVEQLYDDTPLGNIPGISDLLLLILRICEEILGAGAMVA